MYSAAIPMLAELVSPQARYCESTTCASASAALLCNRKNVHLPVLENNLELSNIPD